MAMDPFSVACGATGLASFALDICHEIASYYSAYAAYDSDIQLAYDSVLQLKAILGVINDTLCSPSLDNLDAKSVVKQCISKCRVEIKSLQDYLQKLKKDIPQDEPERRKWIQKLKDKGARLIYPFRKATLGDLRDTVADLRDNLVPALQILTIQADARILAEVVAMRTEHQQWIADETNEKVLDWLSPLDFSRRHISLHSTGMREACFWLFDDPTYSAWLRPDSATKALWCHGKVGSGKSTLAAIAAEHVMRTASAVDVAVVYVYCDWQDGRTQTVGNLVGSLLRQLAEQYAALPEPVSQCFRNHRNGRIPLADIEVMDLFRQLCSRFSRVFIFVDGINELALEPAPERMQVLQHWLCRVLEIEKVHLFVTSRFPANKAESLGTVFVELELVARNDVLKEAARLAFTDYDAMPPWTSAGVASEIRGDPDLLNRAVERCVEQSDGMFLLLYLHIQSVKRQLSIRALKSTLDNLPSNLASSVNDMLCRIEKETAELQEVAPLVMVWVTFAMQPLTMKQLQQAIGAMSEQSVFQEEAIIVPDILLQSCAGLVLMEKESGIVRLLNLEVKKHLMKQRPAWFSDGHRLALRSCITYMRFENIGSCENSAEDWYQSLFPIYPFLPYAARFWGLHASLIRERESEVAEIVLGLVSDDGRSNFAFRTLFAANWDSTTPCPSDVSGLHLAAFFGLQTSLEKLVEAGSDVNRGDSLNRTPLYLAAAQGHVDVVCHLLRHGADVTGRGRASREGRHSRTTTWWLPCWARDGTMGTAVEAAAEGGHVQIVTELRKHGANIDWSGGLHGSPLEAAVFKGRYEVVELLARSGVEAQPSVLQTAVYAGRADVLRLLLATLSKVAGTEWRITWMERPRFMRQCEPPLDSILYTAALANRMECAKLVFDPEFQHLRRLDNFCGSPVPSFSVDACTDGFYRTPLQAAASQGHQEMMELLLKHGADIGEHDVEVIHSFDKPVKLGRLHPRRIAEALSGSNAKPEPCEMLEKVIDPPGNRFIRQWRRIGSGRHGSALQAAAYNGRENAVTFLLERGADVNMPAGYLGTALQAAALAGKVSIVEMLVRHGADVNTHTGFYGNPLQAAAAGGHGQVVEALLKAGAKVNARGGEYGFPLQAAARSASLETVNILLKSGAQVNARGGRFCTALQAAAIGCPRRVLSTAAEDMAVARAYAYPGDFEDFFQLARDEGACSNVGRGYFGHLLAAAAGGGFGNTEEVVLDLVRQQRQTFSAAASAEEAKSYEIVCTLLDHGADPIARGGEAGSPLEAAVIMGRVEIVRILMDHSPASKLASKLASKFAGKFAKIWGNALESAVQGQNVSLVRLLLEHPRHPPFVGTKLPIHSAVIRESVEITRLLLQQGADVTARGESGSTALSEALSFGPPGQTQLLLSKEGGLDAAVHRNEIGEALARFPNLRDPEMVRELLRHDISQQWKNKAFRRALAIGSKAPVIDMLLASGVDCDSGRNFDPNTANWSRGDDLEEYRPLLALIAGGSRQPELYELLLGKTTCFSEYKENALWFAARRGLISVVRMLLAHGAIPTAEIIKDIESRADDRVSDSPEDESEASVEPWVQSGKAVAQELKGYRSSSLHGIAGSSGPGTREDGSFIVPS